MKKYWDVRKYGYDGYKYIQVDGNVAKKKLKITALITFLRY